MYKFSLNEKVINLKNQLSISRSGEDICLIDSATTHTILQDKKYFPSLTSINVKVNTI